MFLECMLVTQDGAAELGVLELHRLRPLLCEEFLGLRGWLSQRRTISAALNRPCRSMLAQDLASARCRSFGYLAMKSCVST